MNAGEELVVTPSELVAGGDSLARVDGFPIFTPAVFPGDTARIRLVDVKKGYARGELVELVAPGPLRRAAPCPIAGECGGCDWTALRLDAQLAAKQRILTESLRRIGKFDPASLPPVTIHPSPLNYRLRSRLHQEGNATGFFATQSHRVVPLAAECEVVGVETARAFGTPGANRRADATPDVASADPQTEQAEPPSFTVWETGGELVTSGTMTIEGYVVSADAFFQVNRHLLQTMLRLVEGIAARNGSRKSAIDLYSGAGFFTRPLARIFSRVTAVEGSPAAHDCAKRNAAANVTLVHAPVEEWVSQMPRSDFVFLDPPRAGARRNVIEAVARRAGERICFLACDPVTFARDAARLTASGWRLATLDLLDLFPNTHHVETLASFERAATPTE